MIYPYIKTSDGWSLPDDVVSAFYDRMKRDGTAGTVFMDGCITSAGQFLQCMQSEENKLYMILDESGQPAGICWLNDRYHQSCYGHFCFFRGHWGRKAVALGKSAIEELINLKDDKGYLLDVIVGTVPAINSPACTTLINVGYKYVGVIPFGGWDAKNNKSIDIKVFHYTRRDNEDI